jgi:FkbM family methyltransferase
MFIEHIKNKADHRLDVIKEIKLSKSQNKKLVLYGAGVRAEISTDFLKKYNIDVDAYCVDAKYYQPGMIFMEKTVESFEDKINDEECVFLISFLNYERAENIMNSYPDAKMWYIDDMYDHFKLTYDYILKNEEAFSWSFEAMGDELSKQVFAAYINGKLSDSPAELCNLRNKDGFQYDYELLGLGEHEIIVDCGAYTGDTISEMLSYTKGRYDRIIAFEPDRDNCLRMKENISGKNVTIVNKGVWNQTDVLYFHSSKQTASSFNEYESGIATDYITDEDNLVSVEVTTIDEVLAGQDATFIKMDIEGSELKALEGAADTIRRCHPKLAICVYHRQDDFITIPQYISRFSDDKVKYRFYMRQHAPWMCETVLYAIPERQ